MTPEAIYTAWAMGAPMQERQRDSDGYWAECMPWTEWSERDHIKRSGSPRKFFLTGCTQHYEYRIKPE